MKFQYEVSVLYVFSFPYSWLARYCFVCIPMSFKAQIKQIKITNDCNWNQSIEFPQTDSMACSEKNRRSSNMNISTSREEMFIVARQKQPNSFKSSKMLPDWFFRVVLWLTWPARNPTTLICDWWGHSMRSASDCSETERAGDEVFEEHRSKMRRDT